MQCNGDAGDSTQCYIIMVNIIQDDTDDDLKILSQTETGTSPRIRELQTDRFAPA